MTTEEKAKAYDEAFEKAKKKYESKYHHGEGPSGVYLNNADLEEIFPALKESEDEMIRKEIVKFIKDNTLTYTQSECESQNRWIAYLEKLKEKKDYRKLYEDITKSEWSKKNYVGKSLGENSYDFAMSRQEMQQEQRWMPTENEMGVLYKLCYVSNQISDDDDTELTHLYQDLKREYFNGHSFENMFSKTERETKPEEWSEEDEDMRYKATAVLNKLCASNEEFVWAHSTLVRVFGWLKSLPERFNHRKNNRNHTHVVQHRLKEKQQI